MSERFPDEVLQEAAEAYMHDNGPGAMWPSQRSALAAMRAVLEGHLAPATLAQAIWPDGLPDDAMNPSTSDEIHRLMGERDEARTALAAAREEIRTLTDALSTLGWSLSPAPKRPSGAASDGSQR
jgi:hypothetical protein